VRKDIFVSVPHVNRVCKQPILTGGSLCESITKLTKKNYFLMILIKFFFDKGELCKKFCGAICLVKFIKHLYTHYCTSLECTPLVVGGVTKR
jgi:hypothetical protein